MSAAQTASKRAEAIIKGRSTEPRSRRRPHSEAANREKAAAAINLDIAEVIRAAKLGRSRKEAQVDTCAVFAAALYDLLKARGVPCQMFTASGDTWGGWYHAVVKAGVIYYDSMGAFSAEIFRARSKIHPKSTLSIAFRRDTRADCYEAEFDEMHAFFLKMLTKAADTVSRPAVECADIKGAAANAH